MKLRDWFARLSSRRARRDPVPPHQAISLIAGAKAAPELVQLCTDYNPALPGPWVADVKFDGLRAVYIDGRIVTREGCPLDAARHAIPGLVRLEAAYGCPMVFDGEYVAEAGYAATMAEFKRGEGSGVFWCFDAMPLGDWMRGRCTTPLIDRKRELETLIPTADSPFVGGAKGFICMDDASVQSRFREIVSIGHEGLVLKRPSSIYDRRRTETWRKLKKEIVVTVPIVDILMKNGNFAGILVRGPAGPLKIASGLTFKQTQAFAALSLAGRSLDDARCTIAYNEIAGTSTPRHVRFVEMAK